MALPHTPAQQQTKIEQGGQDVGAEVVGGAGRPWDAQFPAKGGVPIEHPSAERLVDHDGHEGKDDQIDGYHRLVIGLDGAEKGDGHVKSENTGCPVPRHAPTTGGVEGEEGGEGEGDDNGR